MASAQSEFGKVQKPHNRAPCGADDLLIAQLCELSADRFNGQAKAVSNIAPRHRKPKSYTAALVATDPISHGEKEIGNTLLSRPAAKPDRLVPAAMQGQQRARQYGAQDWWLALGDLEEIVGRKRNYAALRKRDEGEVSFASARDVDHVPCEMEGQNLFCLIGTIGNQFGRALRKEHQLIALRAELNSGPSIYLLEYADLR